MDDKLVVKTAVKVSTVSIVLKIIGRNIWKINGNAF